MADRDRWLGLVTTMYTGGVESPWRVHVWRGPATVGWRLLFVGTLG